MRTILIAVAVCAAIAAGCAERCRHHHRRAAPPCTDEGQEWVNPNATPKVSMFGLNDSAPATEAGAYRISAGSITAAGYRHKSGRVESTGCAGCHADMGKRCTGCNKVPPSAEYCAQCHR